MRRNDEELNEEGQGAGASSLFEKPAFKYSLIAGSLFFILALTGTFFLRAYLEQKKEERRIALVEKKAREYDEKYRITMTRIYQNLKLDHFLAAYKNLESLPPPPYHDSLRTSEYVEVLLRVGNGLIQNQLLKEAESVFLTIRDFGDYLQPANEALTRIESSRHLENTKIFLQQADALLAQKRYREAYGEYRKAEADLRAVEIMKVNDVKEYWAQLKPKMNVARFHTLLDDADNLIKEVARRLKTNDFKDAQRNMVAASTAISQAAFYEPEAPEIKDLRRRLVDLDAELGYRLPNSFPVWNLRAREDEGKVENFFNLLAYEMQPDPEKPDYVRLGIKYLADPNASFYVVRYRIYFFNGVSIFNGHFLQPDLSRPSDEPQEILYLQEIPERLRKVPIRRLEIKVFDHENQILSRVSRAFRRADT